MRGLIIGLALALSACAPVTQLGEAISGSGAPAWCATDIVMDDKGMAALELAYNIPAHAYVTADTNNALPDSVKAKVKPVLIQMYDWLKKARAAYSAADKVSFACAAAMVENNSNSARSLLGS